MEIYVVYVLHNNRQHLQEAFLLQGRVMFNQIVITRRWFSRHGGVYVYKRPFVSPSPFLDKADTATLEGDRITLRAPDLITRELSELSEQEGLSRFRLVSLRPINPANLPDEWEAASLRSFEEGKKEAWIMRSQGLEARFRYMAPIRTEASCLHCHQEFAYRVGEVRGGISIEFPVGQMIVEAEKDNRGFSLIAVLLGLFAIALLWLGARQILLVPISRVSRSLAAMAGGDYEQPLFPRSNDELGDLARTVIEMRQMVRDYHSKLEEEVDLRTRDLEALKERVQQVESQRDKALQNLQALQAQVSALQDQRNADQQVI